MNDMNESQMIDKIYGSLLSLAMNPDYDFGSLRGTWGFRTGQNFYENKVKLVKNVRRLAKSCNVLFNDGEYYVFNDRIYVRVPVGLVSTAYKILMEYLQVVPAIGDKQTENTFLETIRYYNKLVVRNDVIAFDNGVLDMVDMTLHDFSPNYHVTYYHPYKYDPKARCTKWHNFLHEVLPDKTARVILQMFLGLGLIERGVVYNPYEGKDANKVELCLILIGSGSNGKSVIFNTAMGIYGKERISGVDYDELTSPGDEGMRARRLLRDALFNWSSDSDFRTFGRKRTGVFKRIVSGEPITDRKIGEDVKENYNLPYLIFNLNDLPYYQDQSLGFIRRLQFVSFDVIIPKERQNPALSQELTKEYSGIFNWVMRGAQELKRRKFVFPSSEGHKRQIILAQLNTNPVLAWVNAYKMRPEPAADGELSNYISTEALLDSLEQFCEDNNAEMPTKQLFGQTMAKIGVGFAKKRNADGFKYCIYGCNEEQLKYHFIIENEDIAPERDVFENDRDSYIIEDD